MLRQWELFYPSTEGESGVRNNHAQNSCLVSGQKPCVGELLQEMDEKGPQGILNSRAITGLTFNTDDNMVILSKNK